MGAPNALGTRLLAAAVALSAVAGVPARAEAAGPRRTRTVVAVADRKVSLAQVRLRFVEARRCRSEPPSQGEGRAPTLREVRAARCRLRPLRRALPVRARGTFGIAELGTLEPDAAGWIRVSVAAVDDGLGRKGLTLGDVRTLEVGPEGGAAIVRLDRLEELRAKWHVTWIQRGVGVPVAFAALHPNHSAAGWARAAAFEALLARQEQALRGALTDPERAASFLRRYAWSPYRDRVRAVLEGRGASRVSPTAP
ncbi:MAG: hypothetical protein D6705_10975 [Deltaproteobacteria bacterium]|nr:MAG: hypothetical protein D6705_10975 [Deltaproteobacteria bacterium]